MITTLEILKVLSKSHKGLSAWKAFEKAKVTVDYHIFRIIMSQLTKKGFVSSSEDKNTCCECGSQKKNYRITEKGRIHLQAHS